MNRKNKIQKMHDKRMKRARAKLKNVGKDAYVSKADRAQEEVENSEGEEHTILDTEPKE